MSTNVIGIKVEQTTEQFDEGPSHMVRLVVLLVEEQQDGEIIRRGHPFLVKEFDDNQKSEADKLTVHLKQLFEQAA